MAKEIIKMELEQIRENQVNAAAKMYVELLGLMPADLLMSAVSIAHGLDAEQALRLEDRVGNYRFSIE